MNTRQIYNCLNSTFHGKRVSFNVVPSDYLDTLVIPFYPMCLVVNTEDSSKPGAHWTAFFRQDSCSPIIFFCSYGLGLETYGRHFIDFVTRLKTNVIQNKQSLQSIGSNVCGQYVIYFLTKMYHGCCLMSLYCNFTRNPYLNDLKVKHFTRKRRYGRFTYFSEPDCVNQCCKIYLLNKK